MQHDQRVRRFAVARVVFPDRIDEAANIINLEVAVARLRQCGKRRNRTVRVVGVETVDAVIKAVREHDETIEHRVGATTVFVNASANIGKANTIDQGEDL